LVVLDSISALSSEVFFNLLRTISCDITASEQVAAAVAKLSVIKDSRQSWKGRDHPEED
jgi:hypothetical protein